MTIFRFKTNRIAISLLLLTLAVNVLTMLTDRFNPVTAILGFIWLILVPGWLITRIIRLTTPKGWALIGFIVGFGLISAMLVGLITNAVLPLVGDIQPLAKSGLLLGYDIVWIGLIIAAYARERTRTISLRLPPTNWLGIGFAVAAVPAVILAVLGAITLNNQGSNSLTVIMLIYVAGYFAAMVAWRRRIPEAAILTGIYLVALALLLMTSLRGWYTTGHDIQREYRVFLLALTNLKWTMSSFKDAYNACVSITILPSAFRQLLSLPEVYVYKTVYQVIFAIVPVLVYLISRRHLGRLASLVGVIFFVSFPTFFGDMPMLNRQEIAFVFVALIFLALLSTNWTLHRRRWTVALLGLGVVLSHYSTTYTMIALLLIVLVLRSTFKYLANHVNQPRIQRVLGLRRWEHYRMAPVNFTLILAMLGASYLWSTQLTDTGNNISRVVFATIQSIGKGIGSDSKSSDTNYSLFGQAKVSDQQRLDSYVSKTLPIKRAEAGVENLYPDAAYTKYPLTIAPSIDLPLTPFGQYLDDHGLPVAKFNSLTRQGSALFLQFMLILGILLLFLKKPFKNKIDNEYRLFQAAGFIFVTAILVLPVLSAEYGLLRAFQQILMLGGAAIAMATIALVPRPLKRFATFIATTVALGFFISSTGLITTFLGGYPAQLHLANSGKYYDLYYAHESEQKAITWLGVATAKPGSVDQVSSSIETDRYTAGRLSQFSELEVKDGIYPGTIPLDSYVFVGQSTLTNRTATIYYNGDPISYLYPLEFLDANKDLIYSNGGARIYR